jgi:hypothetical protein
MLLLSDNASAQPLGKTHHQLEGWAHASTWQIADRALCRIFEHAEYGFDIFSNLDKHKFMSLDVCISPS